MARAPASPSPLPATPTTFTGFLPRHALIMQRTRPRSPLAAELLETLSASHSAAIPPARLMFVGARLDGVAQELLTKMIVAMGLSRDAVAVVDVTSLDRHLAEARPEIVVALGQDARLAVETAQGGPRAHAAKIVTTWHPSDLIARPALKKETWTTLQAVGRELGIMK